MAGLFVTLPTLAANGAGAAVDVSAMGASKTLVSTGNATGQEPIVTIEVSCDVAGTNWAPIHSFLQPGDKVITVVCRWMRAVTSNYKSGGAPVVGIGSGADPAVFATFVAPAGSGSGAAVDTSALPPFKTVQVAGTFGGTVNVEMSENGGTTWSNWLSFSAPGIQTASITASHMRVTRVGVPVVSPGLPLVDLAADNFGGTGDQPTPNPAFTTSTVTIYARTTGSDSIGSGTLANPYATMQRAVRDVPTTIPAGVRYIVDVTGITEVLPLDYELPAWKAPETNNQITDQYFLFSAAVTIQATPRLMAAIPAADAVVAAVDIASATQDAVTQFITVTLNVARASWAANALKGKFVVGTTGGAENAVIIESTNTTILIATTAALSTPFSIMEPSAAISGTSTVTTAPRGCLNAINCDSIAFNGLKVTTPTAGGHGLSCEGNGFSIMQMCELQSPNMSTICQRFSRVVRNWVYGAPRFAANVTLQQGLCDAMTAATFTAPTVVHLRRMAFDACVTIDFQGIFPGTAPFSAPAQVLSLENVLIRNVPGASGDGIRFHGERGKFSRVDIYGCGRHGIFADFGAGFIELLNVRTSGAVNAGNGITVTDGIQVKVDAATSGAAAGTQLRGTTGEMKVGTGAVRTWANFVSGADGRPALNEYDITAAAATGATGTGTRLSQ